MAATIERLKLRLGIPAADTSQDTLLEDILETAAIAVMSCRYPYLDSDKWPDPGPMLEEKELLVAMDLYNKMGAEGQLSHSENGISRSYQSSWISKDLLADIVPVCGVIR